MFTESHCLPETIVLVELDRYLQSEACDGACCRSIGVTPRFQDRLDLEMFEEGFRAFCQDGDWRKVNVHGFALRRQVYLEVGGLAHRYGGFAEMMLAAALRDRGIRLGYAAAAAVQHYYRSSFAETRQLIDYFVSGESRYRAAHPGPDRIGYSFIVGDVRRLRWFSPRWERLAASLSMHMARWRYWLLAWHRTRRTLAYRRWIYLTHRWSRIRFLSQNGSEARREERREPPTPRTVRSATFSAFRSPFIKDWPEEHLAGFHGLETCHGRPMRWTSRGAVLRLAVPAGDYEVRLETGGVRPTTPRLKFKVFFNGRRLEPNVVAYDSDAIRLRLTPDQFHPRDLQTLAFTCRPIRPWKEGVADFRQLGLPIFAIGIVPLANGTMTKTAASKG